MLRTPLALLLGLPAASRAQDVNASGASFLLVPIGARLTALGGAGVADQLGGESLLANPAALAFARRSEIALFHGQDIRPNRDLLTGVLASPRLGTFGASAYLMSEPVPVTDDFGTQTGTGYFRSVYAAASYASTIGRRLGVGLTYRFVQYRFDCSGICQRPGDPDPTVNLQPATSMVDLGAQYDLTGRVPLVLGVAVRSLGLPLQVRDRAQADPLPTQLAVGGRYEVAAVARRVPDLRLRVLGDVVRGVGAGSSDVSLHLGVEGTFRRAFALRGGWLQQPGLERGPSIGFGYGGGRFGFDVARQLTGFSAEAGEPPTYVTLRYGF